MNMNGGSMPMGPLSPAGVDFSNETQAFNFLAAILDDDELKIIGNAYARYFWYGIAVAVGIAAISNIIRQCTLRFRLRAAARGDLHSAKPRHPVLMCIATVTAMIREATYFQFTPRRRLLGFQVPPFGTIILILGYFAFVMALEFTNNDVAGAQFWQARGVRAGWLAVAQVPLLVLLIMKSNIIGNLTGVTHERLNVLHRWSSRITLFLAILHFGYQSYGWQQYGLMKLEWATDTCPPTGIAAFALLLWINLANLVPFRFWSYEIFVFQHIISFFGFIIAIMMHLPSTALWSRIYIYIPIALYLLDRIVRAIWFSYNNSVSSTATLSALEGDVTKITVSNRRIKLWTPGSFVLLSIPKFGFLETHPATILSTPTSHQGQLVFLLKGHKGFTRRIMAGANNSTTMLLPHSKQEVDSEKNNQKVNYRAHIHGPYGGSHSDFAAFDSVCLIAGSTGITFTLAILQDLAERAARSPNKLPVRRIHFVWCVKDVSWTKWCNEEFSRASSRLREAGVEMQLSIHVTCADAFTEPDGDIKECACACDKSLGPCCCVDIDDEEVGESKRITQTTTTDLKDTASSIDVTSRPSSVSALSSSSFHSGRPDIPIILLDLLERAEGESAIGVCGPTGLTVEVRNSLVRLSDERAIHKGTGSQGAYLHVESFC